MVARINSGKSIAKTLNYNEQKLKQGKAECLCAFNFFKDVDKLTFHDKLRNFERLTSLNERSSTTSVHISLNFDPSEKLTNNQLTEIANSYMEKIGFGMQPYLVYRHDDSGHPHIHILTTNIQSDGRRISLHNIGRNQSEVARKEIERTFGLVRAEGRNLSESLKLKPLQSQKLTYGKSDAKRAISNVLGIVVNQYKYSSLAELNAVLKLYNVMADPGQAGSRLQKFHGLHYRILDENGEKVGVPIKASSIYFKPTMSFLENKYSENLEEKAKHRQRLKTSIDWTLSKKQLKLPEISKSLEKERISTVIRQNKEGYIYGITFIDHHTKCVFNGSDLGKQYSAACLLERCGQAQRLEQKFSENQVREMSQAASGQNLHRYHITPEEHSDNISKIITDLLSPEQTSNYIPYQLMKIKRKRKRQSQPRT